MDKMTPLLSEVLRPKKLADLNLPSDTIESLERMAAKGSIMNLLFYGKPGIGKTSAARILTDLINADVHRVDASGGEAEAAVMKNIRIFHSSASLLCAPKVCFIDEADFLTKGIKGELRSLIERGSEHIRFMFTANEIEKFDEALKSRLLPICFDVARRDVDSVVDRMVERYYRILTEMGWTLDPKRLRDIVGNYFPDLRSIANKLQFEFG